MLKIEFKRKASPQKNCRCSFWHIDTQETNTVFEVALPAKLSPTWTKMKSKKTPTFWRTGSHAKSCPKVYFPLLFLKWVRKVMERMVQWTVENQRLLSQGLIQEPFPVHKGGGGGDLGTSVQRGFRNLWISNCQVPPVRPLLNSRIIVIILTLFHHCTLGVWGPTTCLFTSKVPRSTEAISRPDGNHNILVFNLSRRP